MHHKKLVGFLFLAAASAVVFLVLLVVQGVQFLTKEPTSNAEFGHFAGGVVNTVQGSIDTDDEGSTPAVLTVGTNINFSRLPLTLYRIPPTSDSLLHTNVEWRTSDSMVVFVDSTGTVVPQRPGVESIGFRFMGIGAVADVIVVDSTSLRSGSLAHRLSTTTRARPDAAIEPEIPDSLTSFGEGPFTISASDVDSFTIVIDQPNKSWSDFFSQAAVEVIGVGTSFFLLLALWIYAQVKGYDVKLKDLAGLLG